MFVAAVALRYPQSRGACSSAKVAAAAGRAHGASLAADEAGPPVGRACSPSSRPRLPPAPASAAASASAATCAPPQARASARRSASCSCGDRSRHASAASAAASGVGALAASDAATAGVAACRTGSLQTPAPTRHQASCGTAAVSAFAQHPASPRRGRTAAQCATSRHASGGRLRSRCASVCDGVAAGQVQIAQREQRAVAATNASSTLGQRASCSAESDGAHAPAASAAAPAADRPQASLRFASSRSSLGPATAARHASSVATPRSDSVSQVSKPK